jgi:hypothetical protein
MKLTGSFLNRVNQRPQNPFLPQKYFFGAIKGFAFRDRKAALKGVFRNGTKTVFLRL